MPIRIYNSLTKTKEEFRPVGEKSLTMYSCGVTVYDRCHIGHARSLYIFEVIRRYLKYRGYQVKFVRNITDIDDKIINKAKELKKDWQEVVQENIDAYYKDLQDLGIPPADIEPRATENIEDIQHDIQGLIARGMAYEIDGDVYFKVRAFADYGKLSGQSIEKMLEGVRIEPNEKKKDPLDFALWKKSTDEEPGWESPWGRGRPGWHIECSCMSRKHLKTDTLDIHAGGRDLIFPHHENEIAQAEGLTQKPFANYWIHHGLLTINNQKMAKSLGNFITIQDVLKRYSRDILKLAFLQSHYASPLDFSWEKMEEIKHSYERIERVWERVVREFGGSFAAMAGQQGAGHFVDFRRRFEESMNDDFNTAEALATVFDMVKELNRIFEGTDPMKQFVLSYGIRELKEMFEIFGLDLFKKIATQQSLSSDEQDLLNQRQQARAERNFKRSDEIRQALQLKGILVEDSKDGQRWRKI
ncbi:MAG: cysteine--tRNA ligase [Candidatus Omnitrophica bacterium]|nr:cysteine--tRNA ligase [Candidatus Omnitrophota bacterium]